MTRAIYLSPNQGMSNSLPFYNSSKLVLNGSVGKMDSLNQEESEFIPEYLSRLEENVLSELSLREKNYSFRFNGLRRLLKDVHQQKLSRALERLQEDQLIERYEDGSYGLGNSYDMVREYYGKEHLSFDFTNLNSGVKQIYSAFSNDRGFPVKNIIKDLSGKYFGSFRFIGHYFSEGKGRLEWIHADDHSKILISSITTSQIKIVTYNVSQAEINKFLYILQQLLLDFHIIVNFTDDTVSQAN